MSNPSLAAALAAVEASPAGARTAAFFDLDGTIVSGFTAKAFYTERLRRAEVGASELARTAAMVVDGKLGGDMGRLGDIGVSGLRGRSEEDLAELGERLFVQSIGASIRSQARELVSAHRRKGHTVVLASSATHFQVDPVARDLGVEHVLCSELEVTGGLLTGHFSEGMLWGEAKARAVRRFARNHRIDLTRSSGYGNGAEDAAFLSAVGHPHAVNPHPTLLRIATLNEWPVLTLEEPARRGLGDAAATVAAIAGMNVGLLAGFGIGLLRGDAEIGADLALSFGLQSYLGLAGVTLDVVGQHNMWVRRPCVFIMNHQSALDAFIVGALTQRRLSGLGKQEAKFLPPVYLLGRAMNAVWVDRADPEAGRRGQEKLVQRLRDGYSLMIAPEGTRRPTPVLGTFRTGAFHVAHQADVPVVPVIVRNAFDLMPGSAKTSRAGTVQVAVLDPIRTDSWTTASMREHAAHVRQLFVETMENWPEDRQ